jgi:hypothetical protein
MYRFCIAAAAALGLMAFGVQAQMRGGPGPRHGGFEGGPGPRAFEAPLVDPTSEPPSPEVVANRCIHRINRVKQFANMRMHIVANIGVAMINQLQQNGNQQQAANVAANRTQMINQIADNNADRIQHMLEHCTEVLTDLGAAEELIQSVQSAAEAAWTSIEEHRAEEVQRIATALED